MSGTNEQELTFLLTDIQDSTALVRALGDEYADVLCDSRALIYAAVEEHGGRVVDCRADDAFAVFPTPDGAVAAALAAQRALAAHQWPAGAQVRIRMGLHTGTASPDERDDFVGLDVHRAARISSAGHGGQVLLSATTAARVESPVRDLGNYMLAGIAEPEHVFQLLDPDLPSEFPPLRAARRCDTRPLRVALADDSVLVREGIARVLEEAGMEVVAQAGTADALLRAVELHAPDVAIVDIRMPPGGGDEGVRAARVIRERFPNVGVLLLSQLLEPAYAVELIAGEAGSVGYLLKDRVADLDEFAAAVHRVAAGGCALDSEIVDEVLGRRRHAGAASYLSAQDQDILGLVAEGRSDREIAERLFVPLAAAEEAVADVLRKVGLPPSVDGTARAVAVLVHLAGRRSHAGRPDAGAARPLGAGGLDHGVARLDARRSDPPARLSRAVR
jgi:DNA-binding NarL/FixJ family response regulator/class 3 adenylate cyclase